MTDRFNWRDAILAAGTLALLALFAVGVETVVILRHVDQDRAAARQSLSGTTELVRHRLDRAVYFLDRATGKAGDIEQHIKEEAQSREKYDAQAMKILSAAAEDEAKLGALIDHTDASLNQAALPQLSASLQQLRTDLSKLETVLDNSASATSHADQLVSAITPPLKETAEHSASSMSHVDAIAADGQAVADHYKKVLTSPTTPAKAVLRYIGDWFAKFFGSAL